MLAGEKGAGLDEKCGYYGEKIVLFAQALGLNTCWVALTYSKGKAANVKKKFDNSGKCNTLKVVRRGDQKVQENGSV